MYSVNVRSAEGGREPHSPLPEPQAQRLRIVMSNMKRYLCLTEAPGLPQMQIVFFCA